MPGVRANDAMICTKIRSCQIERLKLRQSLIKTTDLTPPLVEGKRAGWVEAVSLPELPAPAHVQKLSSTGEQNRSQVRIFTKNWPF
jgi:hypothetical protein